MSPRSSVPIVAITAADVVFATLILEIDSASLSSTSTTVVRAKRSTSTSSELVAFGVMSTNGSRESPSVKSAGLDEVITGSSFEPVTVMITV